jgi:Holliday junction resolvase
VAKKTPESKVKAAVVEILKSRGAYYFFPVTGGFGRSGIPDIVACYRGWFIGIECKAGNNKTTALQDFELKKIMDAGGVSLIINEDDIHDTDKLLNSIDTIIMAQENQHK